MSWPKVSIESLKCEEPYSLVGGPFGSRLTAKDYVTDGVPVIRGANLPSDRFFHEENFVFVSEQKARELSSNIAYREDVIFTQRGTLGQVGWIPPSSEFDRYVISQSQMKLTVDSKRVDPKFVYYFFRHPNTIQSIKNRAATSGVPHINLGILREFEVPLPPIHIQRSISSFLGNYDDLIENNRRRIQLLEQSARLLYKEWFVHLRFPGHEHVEVTNGVPQGWHQVRIEEVVSYMSRGITPKYNEAAQGVVINQKCIRDNLVNLDLARRQSKPVPAAKLVRFGDILVNSTGTGTLGRVAQMTQQIENCTADSHVTIVRPADMDSIHYLGMTLSLLEPHIATMGRGATNQTELAKSELGEIRILWPSSTLRVEYEEFSHYVFRKIDNLVLQNKRFKEARDLLLPRLMNGEIPI